MSPEVGSILRERAIQEFYVLKHPVFGLSAATLNRNQAFFARDLERFIKLVLTKPANLKIPGIIEAAEQGLDTAAVLQGDCFDDELEMEPGKIIHEWRNGFTPQERLLELKAGRWPVRENNEGILELKYFGAGDTTSGFITAVAILARAKEMASGSSRVRDDYLVRMLPFVRAAHINQTTIADLDGDGLIEVYPKNKHALRHHTEKDSGNAYHREKSERRWIIPKPPFKYLSNNCHSLEGLRETAWIAQVLGDTEWMHDAQARYERGREKIIEVFWMPEYEYPSPLIDRYGKVEIINDDAADLLFCQVIPQGYFTDKIVARLHEPDMQTRWGHRSRSSTSSQYHTNGAKAYWSGTVWPHREGVVAEGYQFYGYEAEAKMADEKLVASIFRMGPVELEAVDRRGRLSDYRENHIKVAGIPQLFDIGAVLARTAHLEQNEPL